MSEVKPTRKSMVEIALPLDVKVRVGRPHGVFGSGVTMILAWMNGSTHPETAEVVMDQVSLDELITALQSFRVKTDG